MKENTLLIFSIKNDIPYMVKLKDIAIKSKVEWRHHNIADVAIIGIDVTNDTTLDSIFKKYALPVKNINAGKSVPSRDQDITFYGYPVIDLKLQHISALSFKAYLSSGLITQKINNKYSNVFFLDKPSIQGCSGSGVFIGVKKPVYVGRKTFLIGIMHGTQSDNTGGKMACVIPSYYIIELINGIK